MLPKKSQATKELVGFYDVPNPKKQKLIRLGKNCAYLKDKISLCEEELMPPGAAYFSAKDDKIILPLPVLETVDPLMKMPIKLRPEQQPIFDKCLNQRAGLVEFQTGGGKTIIMTLLTHCWRKKTLILVHSQDNVKYFADTFKKFLGVKIGQYYSKKKDLRDITVTTFMTATKRQSMFEEYGFDNLLVDECFIAGTRVLTPNGYKNIETLKKGDTVNTVNGISTISETGSKFVKEVYVINKTITCTGNHLFLTQRGWVRADQLTMDDQMLLYSHEKTMQKLRCADICQKNILLKKMYGVLCGLFYAKEQLQSLWVKYKENIKSQKSFPKDLQSHLSLKVDPHSSSRSDEKGTGKRVERPLRRAGREGEEESKEEYSYSRTTKGCEYTTENEKPNVGSGIQSKDDCEIKIDGTQTKNKGWKWATDTSTTEGAIIRSWRWLVCRTLGCNGKRAFKWGTSESLQDRHCEPKEKVGNRGGWEQSRGIIQTKTRQEERGAPSGIRVESIEIQKQGSYEVFDISVKKDRHFVIDGGIVVHNCDAYFSDKARKFVVTFPAERKFGFTGTIRTEPDEYMRHANNVPALIRFYGMHVLGIADKTKNPLKGIFYRKRETEYYDDNGISIPPKDWHLFRENLDNDDDRKADQINYIREMHNHDSDSSLVLFDRVSDVERFHKTFKVTIGMDKIYIIHGSMSKKDREQMLGDFRKNGGILFAQYKTVGRGYDNDKINKCFMLFPAKGENSIRQMAGRTMRWLRGKDSYLYTWADSSLVFQHKKRMKIFREFFNIEINEI